VGDPAGREPVGKAVEIAGERGERAYRRRVAIRRNGNEVFRRPAIDPGCVWMEPFERMRRGARFRRRTAAMAFHRRLLSTGDSLQEQDADEGQSPKRDHVA